MTLAFLALLGPPYIYDISSLRVKIVICGAEHCRYSKHIANETLGKVGRRWERNTSMDLYDIRWVGSHLIYVAGDRGRY